MADSQSSVPDKARRSCQSPRGMAAVWEATLDVRSQARIRSAQFARNRRTATVVHVLCDTLIRVTSELRALRYGPFLFGKPEQLLALAVRRPAQGRVEG